MREELQAQACFDMPVARHLRKRVVVMKFRSVEFLPAEDNDAAGFEKLAS